MHLQAKDFDPDSLRSQLPKAVSSLEWAISEGKGKVYVHCTAGLGRAPAVSIAYLFWFCDMSVSPQILLRLKKTMTSIRNYVLKLACISIENNLIVIFGYG